MVTPATLTTKLDGSLGITPGSTGRLLAIIGPSSAGTAASPVALARASDVVTAFGYGPLTEAACYAIVNYGRPVLCVKAPASTVGTITTDGYTRAGSSVFSASGTPNDDYEFALKFSTGGIAIGTTGNIIQWSLDAGRTWSAQASLATANSFVIPNSGVTISFAAGTPTTGDEIHGTTTAPACTSSDLTDSLTALKQSAQSWEFAVLVSPVDATIGAILDAWIVSMVALGKPHWWIANAAIPTSAQTDSAYQASITSLSTSYSSTSGSIAAGAARVVSGVPSRGFRYVRPVSLVVAPLINSVSEEVRISQIDGMSLPGVSVTDENGNPAARCHDEYLNSGLDDLRFLTLRTWAGESGVWCNRPRMFGSASSDFNMIEKIRVWNRAATTLFAFFNHRLQQPILVGESTGYILESVAKEIETASYQALANALLSKPKASSVSIAVSRTDNLISSATPTLTVDARIQPLAYPDFIDLKLGFAVTVTKV